MSFRNYTKLNIVLYMTSLIVFSFFVNDVRIVIDIGVSLSVLLLSFMLFRVHQHQELFSNKARKVLKKEPSFLWLALIGLLLGLLGETEGFVNRIALAVTVSCLMLHVKYIVLYMQIKKIFRGI